MNQGVWWTAAASRGVALKQCLQLPVPLWMEVLCLMGGEQAATVLATWASSTVALPVTNISPVFLPLAVGVAVLARRGRALWPAFVVGDIVGQFVAGERLLTWIALSVACHLATVLIGATLIQRHRAWVDDLASTARYLAIAAALAVAAAVAGIIGLALHGFLAGPADALGTFAFWVLGDFGGYVVLGAAFVLEGISFAQARRQVHRGAAEADVGPSLSGRAL